MQPPWPPAVPPPPPQTSTAGKLVLVLLAGVLGLCALCGVVIVASLFVPNLDPSPDARAVVHSPTDTPRAAAPDVVRAPPLDVPPPSVAAPSVSAPQDAATTDVDPVFAALTDRAHLAAARAAMADGYEREERVGGELDVARRHLDAIPPASRLRGRADVLVREIEAREARMQAMLAASAALDQQQQADRAARGEEPARLPNGSLFEVNRHMREVLSDPSSYDPLGCGPVRGQGPHWVVTCSFRARSESGLLGLNVWIYRLQAGRVVEAGPASRPGS
jgi:hypothetical protein